jgi:V8-like Glu-specific endopeptidase
VTATTSFRRRLHLFLTFIFVLASLFVEGSLAVLAEPQQQETPQPQAVLTPCLPNDPYQLADLEAIIDSDTPPSTPVQVNRFVSVRYLGQGTLTAPPSTEIVATVVPTGTVSAEPVEPAPDPERTPAAKIIAFNTRTLAEYEITLSAAMLDDIHGCRDEAGMTLGSDAVGDPVGAEMGYMLSLPFVTAGMGKLAADVTAAGRSNGLDSRINWSPSQNHYPRKTIVSFGTSGSPGCTGTMIGPRHMITAAHCVVRYGTSNYSTFNVAAARHGNTLPFGSIQATPSGASGSIYLVWGGWTGGQGGGWDWALVVLPNGFTGLNQWMGYGALSANALVNRPIYTRGYPTCRAGNPTHPSPCNPGDLYGDLQICQIGEYSNPGPDNWNRVARHSCDTSAGQSGSALYTYLFDQNLNKTVPMVLGVHNGAADCDGDMDGNGTIDDPDDLCTDEHDRPNFWRRNTPSDLWIISLAREFYP